MGFKYDFSGTAARRSEDDLVQCLGCVVDGITLGGVRDSAAVPVGILPSHRSLASSSFPSRLRVVVVASAIVSFLSEPPRLSR
jgi:hypothetical protein